MLKNYLFLPLLCLLATSSTFAKIWRVNNNSGIVADFTTVQAAHNAATTGDTLFIEGSPNGYGYFTCSKKLFIAGPGFYLAENPDTQEALQTAQISGMSFNRGSSGSLIMGVEFTSSVEIHDSSISVKRNKFILPNGNIPEWNDYNLSIAYITTSSVPVSNVTVSQNYGISVFVTSPATGVVITNNYILVSSYYGDQATNACLQLNPNAEAVIKNNIFRRGRVTVNPKTALLNNIMVAGTLEGGATFVANNLSSGNQFGSINGNQSGVNMSNVFAGMVNGIYTDAQWRLKLGSPALGAGYESTPQNPIDAGMYSGEAPYVVSGLPPIPRIYAFDTSPIGSNVSPIQVTIKVKSGN